MDMDVIFFLSTTTLPQYRNWNWFNTLNVLITHTHTQVCVLVLSRYEKIKYYISNLNSIL